MTLRLKKNPNQYLNNFIFGLFYNEPLETILEGKYDHNAMDGRLKYESEFIGKGVEINKRYTVSVQFPFFKKGYSIYTLDSNSLSIIKNKFIHMFQLPQDFNTDRVSLQKFILNFMYQSNQYLKAFRNADKEISLPNFRHNDKSGAQEVTCVEMNVFLSQIIKHFYNIDTTFQFIGPHPFLLTSDGKCIDFLGKREKAKFRLFESKEIYFKEIAKTGFGITLENE